jgi:hypothetical protein
MSEISNLAMDLAASIWLKPACFEDLYARKIKSFENSSEYMFYRIVKIAESKNWIYRRGEIYYCYKKTVKKILNPAGYEMDLPIDTTSEFRKDFDKFIKNI